MSIQNDTPHGSLQEKVPLIQPTVNIPYERNNTTDYSSQTTRSWGLCTEEGIKLFNVIIMGFGFMLLFIAYNTTQNFETKLLSDLGFGDLGFYSLSVLYVVGAIAVFGAAVAVHRIGERPSMWIGAVSYCCYIASLIVVKPVLVYIASVVIGMGSNLLWVGQGTFLTRCSDDSTRGRNSGLFWALFQLSGILGNLGAFIILNDNEPSKVLFTVLLAFGIGGVLILLILRPVHEAPTLNQDGEKVPVRSVKTLFINSFKLMLFNKQMILLSVLCFYTGFELAYTSGEFPLLMEKKLIGAVMTCWGAAEVFGGLVMGKISDLHPTLGKKFLILFAYLCYGSALVLSWFIKHYPSLHYLPFIAAVGLGLGDSCFNTGIFASIGHLFPKEDTVAAFTVFNFLQGVGSAVGFFYSPFLPVHGTHGTIYQLIILGGVGFLAVVLFFCLSFHRYLE